MSNTLTDRVSKIQSELKVPKGQMNKFGGYAYRSCEDILEAVKPHLNGLVLTVTDTIQSFGDGDNLRVYVTAKASISDESGEIVTTASAREPLTQKGMNEAQITGSASSYARKYALNGLFLIDDTKDADATNDHGKKAPKDIKSPVKKKTVKTEAAEPAKKSGNSFRNSVKKPDVAVTADAEEL